MKRLLIAGAAAAALCLVAAAPAAAADNVINIGDAFGSVAPYVNAGVSALIFVGLAWGFYVLKSKWGVDIDQGLRDGLQTWLQRQAASLVADGQVRVSGLTVSVASGALAQVANLAIREIPDAIARFGLTPDKLADMVKDKLPHVPAVAAVAAAQAGAPVTPPPAKNA